MIAAADLLKLAPVASAKVLTLAMQATAIKETMTAYSTAVGPSSLARNLCALCHMFNTLKTPDISAEFIYWDELLPKPRSLMVLKKSSKQ